MLRGVNRRIIEINETGNQYFERAILYVRADCIDTDETKLFSSASDYLKSMVNLKVPEAKKRRSKTQKKTKKKIIATIAAFLFAAIVALCIVIL